MRSNCRTQPQLEVDLGDFSFWHLAVTDVRYAAARWSAPGWLISPRRERVRSVGVIVGPPGVEPCNAIYRSREENMSRFATLFAGAIAATIMTSTVASAQSFEVKRYNPSPWTKTFFTEIVTVNGPGKSIYLAGVGAEDENGPVGSLPPILHLGNAYEQCRYAY